MTAGSRTAGFVAPTLVGAWVAVWIIVVGHQSEASHPQHVQRTRRSPEFDDVVYQVQFPGWPGGVVPYEVSPLYRPEDVTELEKSMEYIMANSCVRFMKREGEDAYLHVIASYDEINDETSTYLYGGGRTVLLIPPHLLPVRGRSVLMLMLGFAPEHTRGDRDEYITLDCTNCIRLFRDAMEKRYKLSVDLKYPYDSLSMTHIGSLEVEKINATMVAVDPSTTFFNQKQEFLSETDLKKLDFFYNCSVPKTTVAPTVAAATTAVATHYEQTTTRPATDSSFSEQAENNNDQHLGEATATTQDYYEGAEGKELSGHVNVDPAGGSDGNGNDDETANTTGDINSGGSTGGSDVNNDKSEDGTGDSDFNHQTDGNDNSANDQNNENLPFINNGEVSSVSGSKSTIDTGDDGSQSDDDNDNSGGEDTAASENGASMAGGAGGGTWNGESFVSSSQEGGGEVQTNGHPPPHANSPPPLNYSLSITSPITFLSHHNEELASKDARQ